MKEERDREMCKEQRNLNQRNGLALLGLEYRNWEVKTELQKKKRTSKK
jgi:hypothetical protein